MNNRQLFLQHMAQTSPAPIGLEVVRAEGNYLYTADGRTYLDIIGGISVCNVGHCRPEVVQAIKDQADIYLHVMVYGEVVQSPQVKYAEMLTQRLPAALNCVYFTNSGSEATDGAIKLARRKTGRTDIIACNNSYHGSTLGALSIMGDEYWRNAFRPLMPGVWHYDYNSDALIDAINDQTAAVVIEPIQAEAGVIVPSGEWMQRLSDQCKATGAMLVVDEIQCGFGRTGKLWGFEHFNFVPDIILLGKALGGGMPLGAFVSNYETMNLLTIDPVLGHITTFGGHPVSCAAGMAAFNVLNENNLAESVSDKEALFRSLLIHPAIKSVSSKGLLMAVHLAHADHLQKVVARCIENGLFTDWFLFAPASMRIAPPLTITPDEIKEACRLLLASL